MPGRKEAGGPGCVPKPPHLTAAKEEAGSAGPGPCLRGRHPGPGQPSGGLLEPGFRQLREQAEERGSPGRPDPAAGPPDTRTSRRRSEATPHPPSHRHPTAPYPERPTRGPLRSTNFPPLSYTRVLPTAPVPTTPRSTEPSHWLGAAGEAGREEDRASLSTLWACRELWSLY